MQLLTHNITPKLTEIRWLEKQIFLYFSYNELIGYQTYNFNKNNHYERNTLLVAKNKWSRTTACHINKLKKYHPNHLQTTQEIIYRESGLDEFTKEEILRQIS